MGSSPLTRGKRVEAFSEGEPAGLIPAHAGKTLPAALRLQKTWAHPRSRGENAKKFMLATPVSGSSPLTRGKPDRVAHLPHGVGLIPAHAGKTKPPKSSPRPPRAHPRSRGENLLIGPCPCSPMGSSPLTRGKPWRYTSLRLVSGLIPAHAGKTVRRIQRMEHPGAHPRSRGENQESEGPVNAKKGSSPLTRGKRREPRSGRREPGLIPAHAGKTWGSGLYFCDAGAHPRSRGENGTHSHSGQPSGGSSPLTRGKHERCRQRTHPVGLIPAHAGKTPSNAAPGDLIWAHPRSRGENLNKAICPVA